VEEDENEKYVRVLPRGPKSVKRNLAHFPAVAPRRARC
jgi:hypothetical protein